MRYFDSDMNSLDEMNNCKKRKKRFFVHKKNSLAKNIKEEEKKGKHLLGERKSWN